MKIGLNFFPIRPQFMVPMARRADELGYDSIWVGEHLIFQSVIKSDYPYGSAGAPLPSTPLFDPLITFAYIAAQTRQIKLGTSVYLVNLRHPVSVAKMVATLDNISGGRVILGVGSGWLKEEYDTVDVDWDHRGPRMEECIHVMRRLWTEDLVAHKGRFYSFEEAGFEPKPAQKPVPILIGGETPAALKRAARSADGWFGLRYTPDTAAPLIRELHAQRDKSKPFEITVSPQNVPTIDEVRRFRDAGVDRLVLVARDLAEGKKTLEASLEGLERFAENVMNRA